MTPYVILVTGPRSCDNPEVVWKVLADTVALIPPEREIILRHGACPTGVDLIADRWGWGYGLTLDPHPAQNHPTKDFGPWPGAGPRRNAHMVGLGADVALAFIGPCTSPRCNLPGSHPSHGTAGCARLAELAGIPVWRFQLTA